MRSQNFLAPILMLVVLAACSDATRKTPPPAPTPVAVPTPAPAAVPPIRLWPQAWPMPGRASYSHSTATRGPPEPTTASNAVGTP